MVQNCTVKGAQMNGRIVAGTHTLLYVLFVEPL
jgi:hypothetical protein